MRNTMIKKLLLNQGKYETVQGIPPLTLEKSLGKDLRDYKIYGNSFQDGTPTPDAPIQVESVGNLIFTAEYQRVEYIESTGTQFIDTGFIPNQDTGIYLDFQITEVTASFTFGARTGGYQRAYTLNISGGNFVTYYDASGVGFGVAGDTKRHIFTRVGRTATLDTKQAKNNVSTFTAPNSLLLLACNSGDNYGYLPSKTKVYSFKIYDGATLVRYFIPCYRKADNVAGMYDIVNDVFYTNAGTGEFIVGGNIKSDEASEGVNKKGCAIPVVVQGENLYEPIETTIYLDEPLRKVGSYADYIDFENSVVVRRVGVQTFDGSETWTKHTTTSEGYGVFRSDNLLTPLINAPITATFMTHAVLTDKGATADFVPGEYRFTASNGLIIGSRLYVSGEQTTVDEYKQWLSENKPKLYYPIATPTVAPIELPKIPTLKGTTILDTNTNLALSNMSVVYKRR